MAYNQFAGVGEETTWGTPVARTKFAKVNVGSFLEQIAERDVSGKLSANVGADAEALFDKGQRGEGKLIVPASYDDGFFALMLKYLLGNIATSGAGPYTHTFTRSVTIGGGGTPSGVALTAELNYELPDAGPLQARRLEGALVKSGKISWNAGEEFVVECDLIGEQTTQVVKSSSPTFPVYDTYEMRFQQCTVSIDGTAYGTVVSGFEVTIDNGYEPRVRMGSITTQKPVRKGKATISGTIRLDWEASPSAKALWDKFVANTASAVVITLTGPAGYSLVLTLNNVKYQGGSLTPEEGQLQSFEMPFVALHDATNTAVKVVLQNSNATV